MESSRGKGKNLNAVISPDFCAEEKVRLTMAKKLFTVTNGNFVATDDKGNNMFQVKDKVLSFHDRHVLLDSGGTPIVTFKKKRVGGDKMWQAFRGESTDSGDVLFSVRKTSIVQFRSELDVFLSGNEEESIWDFKVIGSWFERSCYVYNKDSTIIAKMHKKYTFGSMVLGKEALDVTVYPRVDRAFIVVLMVILYENNEDKVDK